jgi:formamidopyrimidine-DNA glycosylase
MPELPEVATVIRTVEPRLLGRRLIEVRCFTKKVWARSTRRAAGQLIHEVKRYGKFILIGLDNGLLAIHLGMTGKLLAGAERGAYTRAVLVLDKGEVLFDDVRQFGSVRWLQQAPDHLGPDALEISEEEFAGRLRVRKARLKALLLNQAFLRGLGNIYADESLFRAGVHPLAIAARLSKRRALKLHKAIREVLFDAIAKGGSSISDYVDANGSQGSFQTEHRVYQRTGEPCLNCGTPIRRILVAQRATHYCPKCQRS